MDIQITIDALLCLSIIGSSIYLSKTYIRENKRKNVASLKKYRIEILDGTLKKLNNFKRDGSIILKNLEQNNQNPNVNFEEVINQFILFYKNISDASSSYHQDFSVWATDSQKNTLESITNLANDYTKNTNDVWNFNKNNPNLEQKDLPFFDDFISELTILVNELREELNSEIAQF